MREYFRLRNARNRNIMRKSESFVARSQRFILRTIYILEGMKVEESMEPAIKGFSL